MLCIIFYSIIDECGASIYSVSDAAQKEMPSLDPSLRGAGTVNSLIVQIPYVIGKC